MGAHLSEPVKDKVSARGHGKNHSWGSSCMQGWRQGMEDAHITMSCLGEGFENYSLFAVFDGHGGKEVANFCEKHMPDLIRKHLEHRSMDETLIHSFHGIDAMLREGVHQQELLEFKKSGQSSNPSESGGNSHAKEFLKNSIQADLNEAKEKGSLDKEEATQVMVKMVLLKRLGSAPSSSATSATADNVGCTAVVCLVNGSEVICGNAGDSRAIICRKGRPVELSHDHKPNHITEKRRIEAAGGHIEEQPVGSIGSGPPRVNYRVNGNLNLSRAIGDLEYKKRTDLPPERQIICSTPDIIRERITPDDEFLILACDGIWDVKSNEQVCDFVRTRVKKGIALDKVVEELMDECCTTDPKATQGLGADNMTGLIVQLNQTN